MKQRIDTVIMETPVRHRLEFDSPDNLFNLSFVVIHKVETEDAGSTRIIARLHLNTSSTPRLCGREEWISGALENDGKGFVLSIPSFPCMADKSTTVHYAFPPGIICTNEFFNHDGLNGQQPSDGTVLIKHRGPSLCFWNVVITDPKVRLPLSLTFASLRKLMQRNQIPQADEKFALHVMTGHRDPHAMKLQLRSNPPRDEKLRLIEELYFGEFGTTTQKPYMDDWTSDELAAYCTGHCLTNFDMDPEERDILCNLDFFRLFEEINCNGTTWSGIDPNDSSVDIRPRDWVPILNVIRTLHRRLRTKKATIEQKDELFICHFSSEGSVTGKLVRDWNDKEIDAFFVVFYDVSPIYSRMVLNTFFAIRVQDMLRNVTTGEVADFDELRDYVEDVDDFLRLQNAITHLKNLKQEFCEGLQLQTLYSNVRKDLPALLSTRRKLDVLGGTSELPDDDAPAAFVAANATSTNEPSILIRRTKSA
ncbi:hypothetical protein IV203_009766 [Nitzschia inconspicua]|uniref:Uncharacterized protein n=1 Tax=Nitzschia inconspicua TaxID=303405 RepID=A0A9K3KVS0_9STRA|nr:hypothetical protein IV203_009766 [Nitzschia inconspicua]